jgi:two-component system, LytTR family, sensor kinase
MAKTFLRQHIITILAHMSAWAAFLFLPFLMEPPAVNATPPISDKNIPIEFKTVVVCLVIGVFYFNYLVLVPKILNRKGTRYYFGAVILLGLFFIMTMHFLITNISGVEAPIVPYIFLFPFSVILTLSLAIRLLKDRNQLERARKERENETLKSELSFLRSQISPHFLFNIMNNVVALSRVKPNLVEPTLIKLSHLMRYMLYNSDEKKVSIAKEIEYLESYIDLQRLRFGDAVEVIFNKNMVQTLHQAGSMTEGGIVHQIEPMLLIPFVENAFKHGTGMIQKPEIKIHLEIVDNKLIFNTLNKYDPKSQEVKDDHSGIGLKNVSRRLELLYGDNQQLVVNTEGGIFQVKLTILLSSK